MVDTAQVPKVSRSAGLWVVAICLVTIIFDGYDLIVYGAVVPALTSPGSEWELSLPQAGAIGSYALIGMVIGTLLVGALTDILGRRKIMLASIAWFSVAMGLSALAPTPEIFGLMRFVTGIGLGGVVPTAIALTVEYAPAHRRNFNNALMFSGFSIGGVLAAFLAINLLPDHGFRIMFWIGMAPLLVVVPLAWKFLPESAAFLRARGRDAEAEALATRYGVPLPTAAPTDDADSKSAIATLFSGTRIVATVLFGAASFVGLLLVYGLNQWLPKIMTTAGYPLGSALTFLLVLNIGAVIGALLVSILADKWGSKAVTVAAFGAAAASLALLATKPGAGLLMLLIAVAGFGTVGTQILVNGYVATYYPASARATALGWSLGIGRIGAIVGPTYGAWLLASSNGIGWNFYGFAIPAVVGAVIIALVPANRRARTS
ncbi:MFS transporter [Nocardioides sp. NPDC051685]|uniref:MFS transporter n=1 Tax=Nocardioides sp. NPDC051685 TaxID=3364334 RepID=UPI00378B2F30